MRDKLIWSAISFTFLLNILPLGFVIFLKFLTEILGAKTPIFYTCIIKIFLGNLIPFSLVNFIHLYMYGS